MLKLSWANLDGAGNPAAFRRLCVETSLIVVNSIKYGQPPLGGCVLKRGNNGEQLGIVYTQPPLGGCVLKLQREFGGGYDGGQPPLGGCVLKLFCE